jgi:hypothetical protein
MASFYEKLKAALFGGPPADDFLNDPNLFVQNPTLKTFNPYTGSSVTTALNKTEYATPKAAEAVAAVFGGSVAAPSDISGAIYKAPPQQQVNIPGMVGTQNAGQLITTINRAAALQKAQPIPYDESKLANNAGQTEAVYLIGSLAVPYNVWLAAQPAIRSGEGIKVK